MFNKEYKTRIPKDYFKDDSLSLGGKLYEDLLQRSDMFYISLLSSDINPDTQELILHIIVCNNLNILNEMPDIKKGVEEGWIKIYTIHGPILEFVEQ
jgi:hypothetical protein